MYSPYDNPEGLGCPIRTSADQSLLAAPRGFSQPITSFIASWHQGIHQMPLLRLIAITGIHRVQGQPPRRNTLHMIPSTTAITYSQYTNNRKRRTFPIPKGEPSGNSRTFHSQTLIPVHEPARWWAWEDLNFRPHAYQARALTN